MNKGNYKMVGGWDTYFRRAANRAYRRNDAAKVAEIRKTRAMVAAHK